MKCAACGYEYIRKTQWVDDVQRYKSGERKGEVKSIEQKEIVFEVGHSKFIEIFHGKGLGHPFVKDKEWYRYGDVYFYACPECKTVKIGDGIDIT